MPEEHAGRMDVGGDWFLRAIARQPTDNGPLSIELQLWERMESGVRPGSQRITLPVDSVPQLHRLIDEAVRVGQWRWWEAEPEEPAAPGPH
jgi:hypothetical protein